jgi:hypothetical protein
MHPAVREAILLMKQRSHIGRLVKTVSSVTDSVLHYNTLLLIQHLLPEDVDEAHGELQSIMAFARENGMFSDNSYSHGEEVMICGHVLRFPSGETRKVVTYKNLRQVSNEHEFGCAPELSRCVSKSVVVLSAAYEQAVWASQLTRNIVEIDIRRKSAPAAVAQAPPAEDVYRVEGSEETLKMAGESVEMLGKSEETLKMASEPEETLDELAILKVAASKLQQVAEGIEADVNAWDFDDFQIGDCVYFIGECADIEFASRGKVTTAVQPNRKLSVCFNGSLKPANVLASQVSHRRPDMSNHTFEMYHGCSMTTASKILANGFEKSKGGELGPGVYLVNRENIGKAKRFAHDEFHRSKGTIWATVEPEPALIKCRVHVGSIIMADDTANCSDGSWQSKGFSACWAPRTGTSRTAEWCIKDSSQIEIIEVIDIKTDRCPWDGHCPYLMPTRAKNSPWGGRCPCRSHGG